MTQTASDIVRALLELSRSMPDGEGFLRSVRDGLNRHVTKEIVTATLVTPSGSAGALAEHVQKALSAQLGQPVELTERADPTLLGGAVLRYGDRQLDLSIRGGLDQLSSRLSVSRS